MTARCTFLVEGRRGETCGEPAEWEWPHVREPLPRRCREHRPPQDVVDRNGGWRLIDPAGVAQ